MKTAAEAKTLEGQLAKKEASSLKASEPRTAADGPRQYQEGVRSREGQPLTQDLATQGFDGQWHRKATKQL